MQAEEEASPPMMHLWSIFLYGIKALMIMEKYSGRLTNFFDFIGTNSLTT
jgi:hypothetical protein